MPYFRQHVEDIMTKKDRVKSEKAKNRERRKQTRITAKGRKHTKNKNNEQKGTKAANTVVEWRT